MPDRKQRLDPPARAHSLAVLPNVREVEIAEADGRDSLRFRLVERRAQSLFVLLVGAGVGDRDLDEGQRAGSGLILQKALAHPVGRDAVARLVNRRDETRHVHIALLAEDVQTPGAVLSAAPGEQHLPPTPHDSTNEVPLPVKPRCTV